MIELMTTELPQTIQLADDTYEFESEHIYAETKNSPKGQIAYYKYNEKRITLQYLIKGDKYYFTGFTHTINSLNSDSPLKHTCQYPANIMLSYSNKRGACTVIVENHRYGCYHNLFDSSMIYYMGNRYIEENYVNGKEIDTRLITKFLNVGRTTLNNLLELPNKEWFNTLTSVADQLHNLD